MEREQAEYLIEQMRDSYRANRRWYRRYKDVIEKIWPGAWQSAHDRCERTIARYWQADDLPPTLLGNGWGEYILQGENTECLTWFRARVFSFMAEDMVNSIQERFDKWTP